MTTRLDVGSDTPPDSAATSSAAMSSGLPRGALVPQSAREHLTRATRVWCDAALELDPAERFRLAHTAALRAAAAVIAAKPPVTGRFRGRPTSAWLLLDKVAPELAEWSAYFSDSAIRRGAIEVGLVADVELSDADELLRAARLFLAAAAGAIGMTREQRQLGHLPDSVGPLRLAS